MGTVVQMFGRSTATTAARFSAVPISVMRERMRRSDVKAALGRLLDDASVPGRLTLKIRNDMKGNLVVMATLGTCEPRALTSGYPENRLDDFAGIVRTALPTWKQTLDRRLNMHLID